MKVRACFMAASVASLFMLGAACAPLTPPTPSPTGATTAITAGLDQTCALVAGGTVKCWGANDYGQLGDGTNTASNTAVEVTGVAGATAITADLDHTCALVAGGTVKCWGYNNYGQLGNATTTNSNIAVEVAGVAGATAITAGHYHTCALVTGGTVKCWGRDDSGQSGNGTFTSSNTTAVDVTGVAGATAIAAGGDHSCALVAGGTVKCWGQNGFGELGNGTNATSNTAVDVTGVAGATAITAGGTHSCALVAGTVKCWGRDATGSWATRPTPTRTSPSMRLVSPVRQRSAPANFTRVRW